MGYDRVDVARIHTDESEFFLSMRFPCLDFNCIVVPLSELCIQSVLPSPFQPLQSFRALFVNDLDVQDPIFKDTLVVREINEPINKVRIVDRAYKAATTNPLSVLECQGRISATEQHRRRPG